MTTLARSTALDERAHEVRAAYRALWIAVVFDFLAFGIGFGWDRQWHTTHPFEDFFSPPHLFIYTMHLFATITLAYLAFTPSLRDVFGPSFRLFPLPFPVPGPIAIAGGGFVLTALAGMFDAIWHTAFGLDETLWSFPHSMLGSGIFVAFVGIAACRWTIRDAKPIGIVSALVFGFLMLATAGERWIGPIGNNLSREVVEYVSRIPVLAAEPAFQHTTRIYLAYDLDRMNQLFVPLASLSAGMALALLRRFDARPLVMLVLTAVATWTTTLVPFIVPGAVLAINGTRPVGRVVWLLAGVGFAFTAGFLWQSRFSTALVATALFPVGVWLGHLIWSVVERPTRRRVLAFVVLVGIVYPAMTGIVDLSLRARVP